MNPGPNARALEPPGADKRRFVFSALHGSGAPVTTGAPAVCAGFHLGGTPPGCSWPSNFFFEFFFGCLINLFFLAKGAHLGAIYLWEAQKLWILETRQFCFLGRYYIPEFSFYQFGCEDG